MCGLFGIYNHKDAVNLTYFGLYSLQHRGQESAGIVVSNGEKVSYHKEMGLVSSALESRKLKKLLGNIAIGHVRYSTTGSSVIQNAQPFIANFKKGVIAIAHNGNLTNTLELKDKLEEEGSIFQTSVDSEIIVHLLTKSKKETFEEKLADALLQVKGSYCVILLTENKIIAVRDPEGFKPLCLGKIGGSYTLASETCAFDITGAKFIREIEPGEMVVIDNDGLKSTKPFLKQKNAFCIFELVYFARPDSNIYNSNVYMTRKALGRGLAKEHPVKADIVIAIPDSGNYAALGYSQESGIPLELGIIRNHYVGRTFIQPTQSMRDVGVKLKLNPVVEVIKGKRIVVVEDSIVRGTTSRIRVKALREAGAKEIHLRVSCPPIKFPCHYGIDFPSKEELVAYKHSVADIAKELNVDSLGYLSLEGLVGAMSAGGENFCTACFSGKYPEQIADGSSKYKLEEKSI